MLTLVVNISLDYTYHWNLKKFSEIIIYSNYSNISYSLQVIPLKTIYGSFLFWVNVRLAGKYV